MGARYKNSWSGVQGVKVLCAPYVGYGSMYTNITIQGEKAPSTRHRLRADRLSLENYQYSPTTFLV